jgi:hypothetical protein
MYFGAMTNWRRAGNRQLNGFISFRSPEERFICYVLLEVNEVSMLN